MTGREKEKDTGQIPKKKLEKLKKVNYVENGKEYPTVKWVIMM